MNRFSMFQYFKEALWLDDYFMHINLSFSSIVEFFMRMNNFRDLLCISWILRVISSIFRDIHKNTFLFILLLLFYFVIYSNIFVTWKVFKFML